MYDITPTAPPYVLCRDLGLSAPENCTITLNARTPLDSNELMCPGGKVIKQMAVSMYLKVRGSRGVTLYMIMCCKEQRKWETRKFCESLQFNLFYENTSYK